MPLKKGLYKASRGFVHTYIHTYAHFGLFFYRYGGSFTRGALQSPSVCYVCMYVCMYVCTKPLHQEGLCKEFCYGSGNTKPLEAFSLVLNDIYNQPNTQGLSMLALQYNVFIHDVDKP